MKPSSALIQNQPVDRSRRPVAQVALACGLAVAIAIPLPERALAQSVFVNEVADGSATPLFSGHTSLALDIQGNPHITYYEHATTTDLKYARKSGGVWTIEVADGSANSVGQYSSLALDSSGNPHVSYYDNATTDLKYARKSGGVWIRETADGSPNIVGLGISLALDAQGSAHVAYVDATTADIKYARKSGGVWTTETADGSPNNLSGPSLALDAQGIPHVAYADGTTADLKYAWKSGGWAIEIADGSANIVGGYASLALDAQGNPHVTYKDDTTDDLKYARKSGGIWTIETADGAANNVGSYTSLALDAQGNPHVVYYDETIGDLKYARKSGAVWVREVGDASARQVGLYTSLALDAQGNPHVSYFDFGGGPKYANAAVHLTSPTGGVTWAVGSRQEVSWAGVGPIEIALATDGTNFDNVLATGIITSPFAVRVPHLPTRFARMRLQRASPLSTALTDSFFTIDAAIALLKFDAAAGSDGQAVALSWKTEPGPDADVRYRIERAAAESGAFGPAHPGLLDRGEYVDYVAGVAARYRLIAVNGLGEEYVLGETAAAMGFGTLIVTPNPSPGGVVRVLYRVGVDFPETDLAVYDASGRRVRTLVSGTPPAGPQSATWDGRDGSGRPVAAGTYFLRLTWGGVPRDTKRLTVIR